MSQMIFLNLTDANGSKVYVDAFDISIIQSHSFATKQGYVPRDPHGSQIITKAGMPVLVIEKPEEILDKMAAAGIEPEPVEITFHSALLDGRSKGRL